MLTEELDRSKLTDEIVARMHGVNEKNQANKDSDDIEEFPVSQVDHREAKSIVLLLQPYRLQQGLSNNIWQHVNGLATVVKVNVASKCTSSFLDKLFDRSNTSQ